MAYKPKFTVGQRVWDFSNNRRVYRKDPETGHSSGGPIFAEHFSPFVVLEILEKGYLICREDSDKKWAAEHTFRKAEKEFYTDAEKEDATFSHDHSYRISEAVRRVEVATLRKIAEIIGYTPKEAP